MAATANQGANYLILDNEDVVQRMKYFANVGIGGVLDTKLLPQVAICAVIYAGVYVHKLTKMKDVEKAKHCAEKYREFIIKLHNRKVISPLQYSELKCDCLPNMQKLDDDVPEKEGWPPGSQIWRKYQSAKACIVNHIRPHSKVDPNTFDSGTDVLDHFNKYMVLPLYKKEMKAKMKAKKKDAMTDEEYNAIICHDDIPVGWEEKNEKPQNHILATKVWWKDSVFDKKQTNHTSRAEKKKGHAEKRKAEDAVAKQNAEREESQMQQVKKQQALAKIASNYGVARMSSIAEISAIAKLPSDLLSDDAKKAHIGNVMEQLKTNREAEAAASVSAIGGTEKPAVVVVLDGSDSSQTTNEKETESPSNGTTDLTPESPTHQEVEQQQTSNEETGTPSNDTNTIASPSTIDHV